MHRSGAIGDTGPCLHRADLFRPPGGYADAVSSRLEEVAMAGPEHIDRRRVALIAWDVCRRAPTLSDHARRAAIRPVLEAWVRMIAATRSAGVPVIYTTPVQLRRWRRRRHAADVVRAPVLIRQKRQMRVGQLYRIAQMT